MTDIHGEVAPGFEPVRDAFARNFTEHDELGAACCVYLAGEPVVDIWGGLADREESRPWQRDTLAIVFSTTKGVTAACVHRLAEQGRLDLDAPVARYWPEFAANGKAAITVSDVLTHRAGLAAIEGELSLEEVCAWDPVCAAIAAQAPLWEPGTAHGYHVRTFGWILGEIVRRISGVSFGRFLAEEFAEPLGLDFYVGLPRSEEKRVATLYGPEEPSSPEAIALRDKFMGPDTLLGRALAGPSNLFSYGPMWNTRQLREAELPSSNGIGDARSVARLYASLVGEVDGAAAVGSASPSSSGVRMLSAETVANAARVRSAGNDKVILVPMHFGLGFLRPPSLAVGCPEPCFGHAGAGGSLGFADPERRVGFGYVMNQMQLGIVGDERSAGLVQAAYAAT